MKFNYLPFKYLFGSFLLLLVFWWTHLYILGLFTLLLIIAMLFFFRREQIFDSDADDSPSGKIFYSPANAKVIEIKEVSHPLFGRGLHELRLLISPLADGGLFLPTAIEVKDVQQNRRGKPFFRYHKIREEIQLGSYQRVDLAFGADKGRSYGISLLRCPLGLFPQIFIVNGDRGKSRANWGFFPFGGTVLLYLSKNYEILVKEGEILEAGKTVISSG